MKSLIIRFLFLCGILLAIAFLVLNTPFVTNRMMADLLNQHFPMIKVEKFECTGQNVQIPNILTFSGVSAQVRQGQRVFDVKARKLSIHNFIEFLQKGEVLRVSSQGLYLKTDHLNAKGVQLKAVVGLNEWKFKFVEGAGFSQELDAGPYTFSKITAHFKANPKKIEVTDIKGGFYGGTVEGQLNIDHKPQFEYVVWSEFRDVSPELITSIHQKFFQQVKGKLSGSLRVVGGKYIDIFTVILKGKKGFRIAPRAFLMMNKAFDEEESAELERLDQSGAALVCDQAVLHVQNSRGSTVMLVFNIVESQDGLVLKGTYPFRWNNSFESFLFPITNP